ncbi:LysR family transcriptional regulator [Pseudomonas sp. ANT_H12B]|uniref:LysR family transcriptional regulator n=1 Tax=Pseudomonas sp. ANT_H12B TaxID=2597348 RepID=UPI0011EC1AD1|nr:LysR family transcriptional regulator [Pseudomonas sp. ANT_H12B]KAA0980411.1 LysR family transcriptional regulator [Pseudomonas sp. ANT_H12B]
MNLRRLETFLAIVDAGTVTAASVYLQAGQPALTKQLKALESELGLQLFDHESNRLHLNAAGREVLPMARHIVQCVNEMKSSVQLITSNRHAS